MQRVRFSNKLLWISAVLFFLLLVHSLIPLPQANASNCATVQGEIKNVKEGDGPGDVLISISGDEGYYYINRGLHNGIKLDVLTNQLMNKTAKVYYIKHWSLLNFNGKSRHVARIEIGEELVYNEWNL